MKQLKELLEKGYDINYGNKLSIINLRHHGLIKRTGYQVHYDGPSKFSKIYKNINEAIDKFLELKSDVQLYPM